MIILRLFLTILCSCIYVMGFSQLQTKTGVIAFKNGKTKTVEILSDGLSSDWTSVTVRDRDKKVEIKADSLEYLTIGDNQKYEPREIDVISASNSSPNTKGVALMQVIEEGAMKLFMYKTNFMFIEDEQGELHKIYIIVKEYGSTAERNLLKVDTVGFLRLEKGLFHFGNEHIDILKNIFSPTLRVSPKLKFSESNVKDLVRDYNKLKKASVEPKSYFTRKFRFHLTASFVFPEINEPMSGNVIEIGTEISFPSRYPTKSLILSLWTADEIRRLNLGFREYIFTNYSLNPYGTIGFSFLETSTSSERSSMFLELGLRYIPNPRIHLHVSLSSPLFPTLKTGAALKF